jgi:ABC-2 type transport system permease protein
VPADRAARLAWQARAAFVVAKKDAFVYYLKPPVVTFGIVFPVFFYLAFAAGRAVAPEAMVPGIVAMALFFTASAIGPLVTPWERQAKTYERLVTSPASLGAILAGDTLAGAAFGALLTLIPIALGVAATPAAIERPAELVLGVVFGAAAFSALGVLLAAPATDTPSQVMMLSNLVRLPLIFVSGVFVPHAEMPSWGRWLAPFSPLSYAADLVRLGFGQPAYFGAALDVAALALFAVLLLVAARLLHARARSRGR